MTTTAPLQKVRFAQLSFWFGHANGICSAAQQHPNVELACVWDEDRERGTAAALYRRYVVDAIR